MKKAFQAIFAFLLGAGVILGGVTAILGIIALIKMLVNYIW